MLTQNIDSIAQGLQEKKDNIKSNPLKYDIHPLDFIKKKTIKELDDAINIAENSFSPSEKNHGDTLDEAYGGSADQAQKLDEFWAEFFDGCFPG